MTPLNNILSECHTRSCFQISSEAIALDYGWANFSDKRPRFRLLYHLRPQSKLISNKHVVCSLAVDHCDMTKQVGMCMKITF